MTTHYFDSSALVKRYMVETGTAWVQRLCTASNNTIVVAELGLVEVAAAFAGKRRGRFISASAYRHALADLQHDAAHAYLLAQVNRTIIDEAINLTMHHRLRGYDAVHLATALYLNQTLQAHQLPSLDFICADNELLIAAQAEGLTVDNPNHYP